MLDGVEKLAAANTDTTMKDMHAIAIPSLLILKYVEELSDGYATTIQNTH